MNFTQFMFPNGRKVSTDIEVPPEIEKKASELASYGWSFEIEIFPETQVVNMDCCDEEEPIANELCTNGPDVPKHVEKLVERAHQAWLTLSKPKAVGNRAGAGARARDREYADSR